MSLGLCDFISFFVFNFFLFGFLEKKIEKFKLVFWLFLFFEFSFPENENGKMHSEHVFSESENR